MTGSLIVVLALVFAALFMLALLMTGSVSGTNRGRDVADRIERYGPRHAPAPASGDSSPARGAVGWVTSLLQSTNSEKGLAERLDLAGSERRPAEWVLLGVGGSALIAAALTLATGNLLIGIPGGA